MNKLQSIFHAITGFKASYVSRSAESDGWEDWDAETLINVVDNLELESIDADEANKLHAALTEFKNCDTGSGNDLDMIFNGLSDEA